MPFDEREFRLQLRKSVVDAGHENYKENVRIAALLDDKAQKTGALAGIFLAAAFASIRPENFNSPWFNRPSIFVPLLISIISLIVCIAYCLGVMWVRPISGPLSIWQLDRLRTDLFQFPRTNLSAYEEGFWGEVATIWKDVLYKQTEPLNDKAKRLRKAQVSLLVAMFMIAVLLLLAIISKI